MSIDSIQAVIAASKDGIEAGNALAEVPTQLTAIPDDAVYRLMDSLSTDHHAAVITQLL